jgi:putative transposase
MPRVARVVVPGVAHHVTQRGNRRQTTFFRDGDYRLYRQLLAAECERARVEVWAYCWMPNHVHLVLVPAEPQSLARALGRAHRAYSAVVNRREGWRGYLWQGRFASYPMDETHLMIATRYVLLNPVRAGLVGSADEWPYSSLAAHRQGFGDGLVDPGPMAERIGDWDRFLAIQLAWNERQRVRSHFSSGLPLGPDSFVDELERRTGRVLRPPTERLRVA